MKSNNSAESVESRQLDIIQRIGGIGYWEYDPALRSIFLPEASQWILACITGSPVNAPDSFMQALGDAGRERLQAAFDQATASNLAFQMELQLVGSDGRPACLAFRGAQVLQAPGLHRLAGIFSDISEEKRREADHGQANVQLQALLDAQLASMAIERSLVAKTMSDHEAHFILLTEDVADVVWKVDSSLHLTYISPADQRLRGYHADEVLGRHMVEMVTEEGIATIKNVMAQRRQVELEGNPDESITFEVQHHCKDGRLLWGEVQSRPVRDANGVITGYHGITRENTKRRQLEADLRQARIAADAANVCKSQFLATMSHEIRTPMNGILGMAQLLLMPNLTESERLLYSKTVLSSGQTLLALLNDILDLSKIEAGKFQLDNIVFEPDSILRETHTLFSGTAHTKGLQLEYQWNGVPSRRYLSDATRIRQMLLNLVGNAIKFTKDGCIRIEGGEREQGGELALLEFSVSDTGMGIPPDQIDLLFRDVPLIAAPKLIQAQAEWLQTIVAVRLVVESFPPQPA